MQILSQIIKSKRTKLLLPVALIAAVLGIFFLFPWANEDKKFQKQADRIFQEEMLANTLNMHYTLAYPENYGITDYEVVLPCYFGMEEDSSSQILTDYLDNLYEIDAEKLSEDNRYTYQLLVRSLEGSLEGSAFSYFEEPLSPSSGMQSQLPILLAEYSFRCERDITDYLSILDQTDEYFSSLALYEADKKAAGLCQADSSLNQVIEQCSTILSKTELDSGTHFLQTTFAERLNNLLQNNIITQEAAEYYLSLNDRLLTTVMQPAYDKLADDLLLLVGDGSSLPKGLASFPSGKEYYSHLVKETTGSNLSPDAIKELLYPTFRAEYGALQTLLRENPQSITAWTQIKNDTSFPYHSETDILADLTTRMAVDFPLLPTAGTETGNTDKFLPAPSVKTVSNSLAAYCAPAFYLTPPLDDTLNNVIYINPLSTSAGLELYTTLAHEGYPGHLYQSVYNNANSNLKDTHPVRQILWYGGYQEGWALYVEFISYDYAIDLAKEQGNDALAYAYEIEKHNRSMQLCLYSLLDVSIHYDNASYEQIHNVLCSMGIKDAATTRAVYDYIAEEPANYLKYYLGYLEILNLKEKAMALWQENYSDMRFHEFLLDCGPSDFETLEMTLS